MIIGNRDGKVILEFGTRKIELTEQEFDKLVYNLEGKLNGDSNSLMKTNEEIIQRQG